MSRGTAFGSIGIAVLILLGYLFVLLARRQRAVEAETTKATEAARDDLRAHPEKASASWDLSLVCMQGYFRQNTLQVAAMFYVAVVVMIIGFATVGAGLILAFEKPQNSTPAFVAAGAGTITQFIGATFMLMYRSTVLQAANFMSILERMNSIGMAIHILDGIDPKSDESHAEKMRARSEVAKILMKSVHAIAPRRFAAQPRMKERI